MSFGFGGAAKPPATGGFGAAAAPAATGFGATAAPAATGFGATAAPAATGFGAAAAPAATGFGATAAPATTGFGATAAPATTGFGAAAAPATTGFGAAAKPATTGFGAATGGFGAASGGFGGAAAKPMGGFGAATGGFGASAQPQQPALPAAAQYPYTGVKGPGNATSWSQSVDFSQISNTTAFESLPPPLQQHLLELRSFMHAEKAATRAITAYLNEFSTEKPTYRALSKRLTTMNSGRNAVDAVGVRCSRRGREVDGFAKSLDQLEGNIREYRQRVWEPIAEGDGHRRHDTGTPSPSSSPSAQQPLVTLVEGLQQQMERIARQLQELEMDLLPSGSGSGNGLDGGLQVANRSLLASPLHSRGMTAGVRPLASSPVAGSEAAGDIAAQINVSLGNELAVLTNTSMWAARLHSRAEAARGLFARNYGDAEAGALFAPARAAVAGAKNVIFALPRLPAAAASPAPAAPTAAAGFGAATTGFGAAATTTGFGVKPTAATTGFGAAAPAATTGFGAAAAAAPAATTGFGAAAAAAPAATTGFGAAAAAAPAATTGFGAAAAAAPAATTGFGAAAPAAPAAPAAGPAAAPAPAAGGVAAGFSLGPGSPRFGPQATPAAGGTAMHGRKHVSGIKTSPVPVVGASACSHNGLLRCVLLLRERALLAMVA